MRGDVKKTLTSHYNFEFPMTEPDYYVTEEYRRYRETLARVFHDPALVNKIQSAVKDAFPDEVLEIQADLVNSPCIRFYQTLPPSLDEFLLQTDPEPGETIYHFSVLVSALGPYWHMTISSTVGLDGDSVEEYLESKIPRIYTKNHAHLTKAMKALGYRELDSKEAWEPLDGYVHSDIPEGYVRVGHLLFTSTEAFGVPDFDEAMFGLDELDDLDLGDLIGMDDSDDESSGDEGGEPWMDAPEKPRTIH